MDSQNEMTQLQERQQRIDDAVALRETDRVPFIYSSSFWAAQYSGMTCEEAMYDLPRFLEASKKAILMLEPDAMSAAAFPLGITMELLEYKPMKWPGHGADPNVSFQYLDQEFMSAKEYDDYLLDPTDFYLHKYMPRVAGAFKVLEKLPRFVAHPEWDLINSVVPFADPELQAGLKKLFEIGEKTAANYALIGKWAKDMAALGYPLANGAYCKAPFDQFVDYMRGSKGGMLDMFRKKDKLLAAMEKARVLLLQNVVGATQRSGCKTVFIPLHWGLDGFMSPDQFNTFYWPQLRQTILDLLDLGLVPCVFWEGNCTSRLEAIADVPPGKVIYRFEASDIVKAKQVLGDVVCIRGNVPASLLLTGTADDVDAHCRKLIEVCGKGGGFMLDGACGIPDGAPVETVLAMARSVKKYANG
ncbi:MAG: hypothetical protein IT494_01670 [Gammaproteobacteria bacterium]|nr:hypothetical protein [Gammaproteobacteria bacterium]